MAKRKRIDKHIIKDLLAFTKQSLCLLFVVAAFTLCASAPSYAKSQGVLVLNNSENTFDIAPYSYITIDEKRLLSPDTLILRHRNNLRGERRMSDVLNIGMNKSPKWMVFSIYNKNPTDDWVLHFGDVMDGRMGLIKKIHVMNYTTKQTARFPSNDKESKSSPFLGTAIPLKIAPGTQATFVLYLEANNGLPLMISPKIMTKDTYIKKILHGDIVTIIADFFLIIMMAFFITSFYLTKSKDALGFLAYYGILSLLFFNLDNNIVSIGLVSGEILFIIYISSCLSSLLITKYFAELSYKDHPVENIVLGTSAALILIFAISYLTITPFSQINLILILISGAMCISFITIATFTMFSSKKPLPTTLIFCMGWLFTPLSFIALLLVTLNIIPTNSLNIQIFWFLYLPQAVCFVVVHLQSRSHDITNNQQEFLQKKHDEQSLYKLKKSKESADQARLLRVIERERELMSDLREREIKRAEEMSIAKEVADKASHAKSAFLAVVSHEIRTPMTGILGMVRLLQDTGLTKVQNGYADTMQKSGDSMMALLNDILDFEKIEHGGMDLEIINFDLHQLVQDVVTLMSGHASQENLSLNADIAPDVPISVAGDPTRLRQVLLNLVNNGLKFTEDGGVTIEIKMSGPPDNQLIYFGVNDTGIGIPKDAQDKLFTPFSQAETSTSRKYGGTGLGLMISYKLIEAMGGVIVVDSIEGQGSTFSFSVGLEKQNDTIKGSDDKIQQQLENSNPLTILVVEDNEMNRKVLEGFLSNIGHTLLMAANGLEALDICKQQYPDLTLMDIQMDGMSGIETTQNLRSNSDKKLSQTPIIALTGNVLPEQVETFFAAGMNGFIAKPIDPRRLNEVIYNASIGKFDNETSGSLPVPETGHGLSHIKQKLELDDREHFIADIKIKLPPENDVILKKAGDFEFESDTKEQKDNSVTIHGDNEITEIQKYLMGQKNNQTPTNTQPKETPTAALLEPVIIDPDPFEQATPASPPAPIPPPAIVTPTPQKQCPEVSFDANLNIEDFIDITMLKNLLDTLGSNQFRHLLSGFSDKANEIIIEMEGFMKTNDFLSLGTKAHELKGMAGNFGMIKISDISGNIEKSSKMGQANEAVSYTKKLSATNEQTRAALKKWMDRAIKAS